MGTTKQRSINQKMGMFAMSTLAALTLLCNGVDATHETKTPLSDLLQKAFKKLGITEEAEKHAIKGEGSKTFPVNFFDDFKGTNLYAEMKEYGYDMDAPLEKPAPEDHEYFFKRLDAARLEIQQHKNYGKKLKALYAMERAAKNE